MFKKIIAWTLLVALTATASIGATVAYLTSEDSDANVMTLGNVKIEQHEYERIEKADGTYEMITTDRGTGYKVKDFRQAKPLYPAVGEITGWDENVVYWDQVSDKAAGGQAPLAGLKNVQDKFVLVENIGTSDAYVRTVIAYEMGGLTAEEFDALIGINYGQFWIANNVGAATIAENTYFVVEYVYNGYEDTEGDGSRHAGGILPAGDYTYNNLAQIYLAGAATNEHVEKIDGNKNGTYDILVLSQAVQTQGFADAQTALNAGFGAVDATNAAAWLKELAEDVNEGKIGAVDTWDGTADITWYNDTDTEFVITTAEQLAGLAELVDGGNTFSGKTVKLDNSIDLYFVDENGEPVCFEPIGSYRKDKVFEGTFDGQGNSIFNMSQNTWALDNGYYYGDLGLGLFGSVENATIKNLVMDNASISGESALCGTIAAYAGDNVTFENITVKNSDVADYQYYAGGIVGWAGGDEQFINCNIDASTTIGAQWGEFNNANGGIIAGVSTDAAILMKDCTVACRIDAYNDVVSAYEWYSYRRSGMLIGDSGQKDDPDGDNVANAIAPNLTCENVTVIYDDWANYHYCKFGAMRYPWVRVESGISCDAYSNVRYGHPTDANGNTVVDDNHVHNDGEAHKELIVFDQLYGGTTGDRYCTYGAAAHTGVTVIYNNK